MRRSLIAPFLATLPFPATLALSAVVLTPDASDALQNAVLGPAFALMAFVLLLAAPGLIQSARIAKPRRGGGTFQRLDQVLAAPPPTELELITVPEPHIQRPEALRRVIYALGRPAPQPWMSLLAIFPLGAGVVSFAILILPVGFLKRIAAPLEAADARVAVVLTTALLVWLCLLYGVAVSERRRLEDQGLQS